MWEQNIKIEVVGIGCSASATLSGMATEDPDQISDIQSRMMSVHIEHQRAPHRLRVKALNPFKTSIRLHARHDHIREYRGCCAMDAHFSTAQAEQARKGAEDIAKEALKLAGLQFHISPKSTLNRYPSLVKWKSSNLSCIKLNYMDVFKCCMSVFSSTVCPTSQNKFLSCVDDCCLQVSFCLPDDSLEHSVLKYGFR